MMNSIDELFPLLRFLRIAPYTEWSRFSSDFSKVCLRFIDAQTS